MADTFLKEDELISEGLLKIDEVIIPEAVKNDLKTGTKEIGELIRRGKPDLVIALERSGPIVWDNYSSLRLKSEGIEIPPVVTLEVGREISDKILKAMGTNEEELFADPVLQKKYLVFLSEDPNTQVQVHNLADKIRRLNLPNIKSVLCVDDTRNQGMTMTFTAPWVISEALKEAGVVGPDFDTITLADNKGLTGGYDITSYSQPSVELGNVKLFRQVISKNQWLGFIKNEQFATELSEIAKKEGVMLPLVEQSLYELMKGSSDLGILAKYYNEEDLKNLRSKLENGLRKVSSG